MAVEFHVNSFLLSPESLTGDRRIKRINYIEELIETLLYLILNLYTDVVVNIDNNIIALVTSCSCKL